MAGVVAAVGGLVAARWSDTPTGKIVGSGRPVLVMADRHDFSILNQLKISHESKIVTITYAALIGGVFLAMALAFGLGGRERSPATCSASAYEKGLEQRGRVKQDMRVGKERAKDGREPREGRSRSPLRRRQRPRGRRSRALIFREPNMPTTQRRPPWPPPTKDVLSWRGQDLLDASGDKIGKIEEILPRHRQRRARVGPRDDRHVRHQAVRSSRSRTRPRG